MRPVPQLEYIGVFIGISLLSSYLRPHSILHYAPELVTLRGVEVFHGIDGVDEFEIEENVRKSFAVSF